MTAPAPAPAVRPPFVPALTGVRAFAAGWVMVLHLTAVTAVLLPPTAAKLFGFVALPGFLGVDLFFVLSGFIISYNYEAWFVERVEWRRYLQFQRARLARIYPVHLVLLVALVGAVRGLGIDAGAATDPARWSTVRLIESLVLIQAWLGHTDVWNAVSWSISLEWLAYLLFPAMVWVARRVGRLGPVGLALTLVAITAVPGSRAVMERLVPGTPSLPPLQIISEFLAGCVTYQLFRQQRGRTSLAAHPGWLLLALVVVASVMNHVGVPAACAVPLVPPLLLGLAYGEGRISRWFAHRAMVYGGKISFALYMTHYLWLWVMHHKFPLATLATHGLPMRLAWIAAHALPMPLIAAAVYHLVEEPARHWLVRRAPAAPPGATTR
ncbi:MAG: acyltransferase [Myxococcales bacterium]|nr:acyltransferase [Myxococcales bacterium]